MEEKYWIGRNRASRAMARAASGEASLIHYELAGRHSIKAAECAAAMSAASEDARAVLHLPESEAQPPLLSQPPAAELPFPEGEAR